MHSEQKPLLTGWAGLDALFVLSVSLSQEAEGSMPAGACGAPAPCTACGLQIRVGFTCGAARPSLPSRRTSSPAAPGTKQGALVSCKESTGCAGVNALPLFLWLLNQMAWCQDNLVSEPTVHLKPSSWERSELQREREEMATSVSGCCMIYGAFQPKEKGCMCSSLTP